MSITEKLEELGPEYIQNLINTSDNFCVVIKALGYKDVYGRTRKKLFEYMKDNNISRDVIDQNIIEYKRSVMKKNTIKSVWIYMTF